MDIDPRLHDLKDLDNGFAAPTSYKAFEGVSRKLVPILFPQGLERGRQKAAAAAEMLGFVTFDDAKLIAAAQRAITDGGLAWTTGAQATLKDALKDPARRLTIELELSAGTTTNVVAFAQSISPLFTIEYDTAAVKRCVDDMLTRFGLTPRFWISSRRRSCRCKTSMR